VSNDGVAVVFFNNEKHQGPEKISWDEQRISAVKAASHEIFSCPFVFFVVKKAFPATDQHLPVCEEPSARLYFYLDQRFFFFLFQPFKGGILWVAFSELYPIQIVLMIYSMGLIIIRTSATSAAA